MVVVSGALVWIIAPPWLIFMVPAFKGFQVAELLL